MHNFEIKAGKFADRNGQNVYEVYYISPAVGFNTYLCKDGKVYSSCKGKSKKSYSYPTKKQLLTYGGWFPTKEVAQATLDKYNRTDGATAIIAEIEGLLATLKGQIGAKQ